MAIESEDQAIDVLMAAVAAPEDQTVTQADDETIDREARLAESEDLDREEPAEPDEAKAKDNKTEVEPASEDDYVEEPGEDGAEPTRYKVSDLLASHKELQSLNGQRHEVIERVEREAVEQATVQLRAVEQYSRQAATAIQAAMQLLQPPQPPNADAMLNPASPQYDPDGYHRQFAQYQRTQQQFQQAQGLGQHLMQQAQQAAQQAAEARDAREISRLRRVWPEFSEQATMTKFVDDMGKAYGFTAQELDEVLVDHRQALVARDALAYRAMKAQSGQVKAKVEAIAPKIVRTRQEAKGTPAQARNTNGRFASDALADLKKTGSDDAAVRFFAGLSKAGRI